MSYNTIKKKKKKQIELQNSGMMRNEMMKGNFKDNLLPGGACNGLMMYLSMLRDTGAPPKEEGEKKEEKEGEKKEEEEKKEIEKKETASADDAGGKAEGEFKDAN